MGMLILSIPIAINALAVVIWRGWYRGAAAVLLPFLLAAYLMDFYGWTKGGNLAGIFTILTAPVVLIVLLLLAVGNGFTRAPRHDHAGPATAEDVTA
jgi:hypothetical protein